MMKQGSARGFSIEMMGARADDGGAMGNNRNFSQREYAGGPYPYDDDLNSISTGRSMGSSMHAWFDISTSVASSIGRDSQGSGSGLSAGAVAPSNRKSPFPDSYASNYDEYDNISRGRSLGSSAHHSMSVATAINERDSSGSGSASESGSSGGAVAPPFKPKVTARETQSPRVDHLTNRRGPIGKSGFSGGKVVPANPMSTVREGESLGPMSSMAEFEYGRDNNTWENFEHELYHGNARSSFTRDALSNVYGPVGASETSGGDTPSLRRRSPPPARADPTSTERERESFGSRSAKGEYGRKKNPWDDEDDLYHGNARSSFIRDPVSNMHGHMGTSGSSQTTKPTGTSRIPPQVSSKFPQFLSHEENRGSIARGASTNMRGPVGKSGSSVGAVAPANPTSTERERDSFGSRLSMGESKCGRNNNPWEDNEHELYHGNARSSYTHDPVFNMRGPTSASDFSQATILAGNARIPPKVSSQFPQIDQYLSHEENRRLARDPSSQFSYGAQSSHEESRGSRIDRDPLTKMRGPMGTSGTISRRVDCGQLMKEGYSTGLARSLSENAARYDFRYWLVDNSGSMQIGDGHRIVWKDGKAKQVACTRWEEITHTVTYHARMASLLECPTIFHLLNDPAMRTVPNKFSVCENGALCAQSEVSNANEIMRKVSPSGVTPLTRHILNIQEHLADMADELRRNGKIVAIILATDGLPTDERGEESENIRNEFIRALRSLEGLPVWTVIRLCTDEDAVKRFYNTLDDQLELSVEVLDDYAAEAKEVYEHNPWIAYALPLHRCRELGYHVRLFDMIDERPLTPSEIRSFCLFILGLSDYDLPDPGADPSGFLKSLNLRLEKEQLQWNPIKKKMTPWIMTKDLKKIISSRSWFRR